MCTCERGDVAPPLHGQLPVEGDTGRVTARYTYIGVVGRSRDRFPVVSLDFSVTYSFRPHHGPGVESAPSENEYQEHFLRVKAAGA